ncbi:hypothetical protein DNH61_17220 [Paenibacillus sambharensis]|uniref:histidine kinase n=1 Tax=Paenibacillus sambharensis TaxID=1803190 RepID=A0A2W1LS83_9BACL|nr:PAS domain-containing sensor histidine kinase [Paenibacillus sambharensis]PZD94691.1 hypothetical protein DNH61_17220 [Paenibacillus sambharensis]
MGEFLIKLSTLLFDILNDLCIFTALLLVLNILFQRFCLTRLRPVKLRIKYGLAQGGVGTLLMMSGFELGPNFVLDLRYLCIAAAARFWGWQASLTAALVIAVSRWLLFGVHVPAAVSALLMGAACGLIATFVKPGWKQWACMNVFCIVITSSIIGLMFDGGKMPEVLASFLLAGITAGLVTHLLLSFTEKSGQLQLQLKESTDKYESLVNNVRAIIFQTDAEGRWVFLNEEWTRVTGRAVEESLGERYDAKLHPSDKVLSQHYFEPLYKREIDYCHQEMRYQGNDGEQLWIEVHGRAIIDKNGHFLGTFGTISDITKRKQAEQSLIESEERYRLLVETSPEAICVFSMEETIVFYNEACARLLGYQDADLMKESIYTFVPREQVELIRKGVQRVFAEPRHIVGVEFMCRRRDGSMLALETSAAYVKFNGLPSIQVIFRDNTERKQLHDSLMQAKARSDEASQAKSDFLAAMNHELRTPLNGVLGFAQLLKMGVAKLPDSDRLVQDADKIITAGNHLLTLINDILDLSSIEAGKMRVRHIPVGLGGLLEDCVQVMQPLAGERGITIMNELGSLEAIVLADPVRLRQVMFNLLSNAIKYNRTNGTVTLSGHSADGIFRLSVSDTGTGIPPNKAERIFEPFYRAHASPEVEGTGIGLTLTKRLLALMDGNITVESDGHSGSVFNVELQQIA